MKHAKQALPGLLLTVLGMLLLFSGCSKLNAPEHFQTVSVDRHQAQVSWEESPNADRYEIQIVAENGLTLEPQTTQSTSLTLDGLTADTSYTLTLTAWQGETSSDPAELTLKTAPIEVGTVENVTATLSESDPLSYVLSWDPYQTQETSADGSQAEITYGLYESTKPDVGYQLVRGDLKENSYAITATKQAARRYYKVCPVLTVDGKEFTGSLSKQPAAVVSGVVNDLTLSAQSTPSHSVLTVSWTPYDTSKLDSNLENPAVTYTVYGAYAADGEYEQLVSGLTDPSWDELGLLGDMTRYYKITVTVTAGDLSVTSAMSASPAGATTPLSPVQQEAQQEQQQPSQPPAATSQPTSSQTDTSQPTTSQPTTSQPTTSQPSTPTGTTPGQQQQKLEQARAVAQQIADEINANFQGATDLEKVNAAAQAVAEYCRQGSYTTEGEDYSQAYGVFIKGEYSCAGATRALGLVLDCLGYSWEHVNESQWTHQWCSVTMDGQTGWADGQLGMADYGEYPYEI